MQDLIVKKQKEFIEFYKRLIVSDLTEKDRKFIDFYNNMNNWNPPTYRQLMEYMGYKSKCAVSKKIKKLKSQLI